nr:RNA-directed DNA polymerase, eukaryota, reverse transcriptase zinc-binding domain protein [Tanacetum cinerariifolium]
MVLHLVSIDVIGTLLVTMLLMLSNGFFAWRDPERRPISLIGSLYKVIVKVLANSLVIVLDDIVDEIQSAFVTDRQILDGPFILNEIVHWCKNKKKQSMIFKVDFEKAYDFVRWDFIDDILKRFGFGEKWCKWIQSCLYSSRGSVLVNGSPMKEFQFHKGLFNGIKLDSSLQISHLFYADDAIFTGQWSQCNIDTIIQVVNVFYRASGLRINMNKSNLMGISVDSNKVKHAAAKIGAIPIYHMSIFKVPMNVLQNMESILARFFNGADVNSKKPSWVRWKSILAAKDVGGLGVSSLFALNRALMFKWVWRFFSQKNSLWVRVVKALHGEDGKIGKKVQPSLVWGYCLFNLVPRLYELESMKNIDVASKLSHEGLEFSFRRNPRGGVEQAQFERLKEMVEGVTLSNSNDRWSWSLVGSGDFSVSSVRKLIDNVILPKGILKTRRIKEVPIKINVHAWKVIHDCLPTRFNISRRASSYLASLLLFLIFFSVTPSTNGSESPTYN